MTWANRIRLLIGLLVVLAIVGACTVVFTQRQSRAESTSAVIVAEEYSVGSSYAGTVTEQLVEPGDDVAAGDTLLRVRSPQLARDLTSQYVTAADIDAAVDPDGTYSVVATVDGTVADVLVPVGDFAPGGAKLALIDRAKTMQVEAVFVLTPRDYGRVAVGSAVDLLMPDDTTLSGRVKDIAVETTGGLATSTVTIESASLDTADVGGLMQPGTPVRASLHLRDDGPLAGVSDALRDFARRIGL